MDLGVFSLSLSVEDIDRSLQFYESLGFRVLDGGHLSTVFPDTETTRWRILEHDSVKIGLFQGMIDRNIITFHPDDVLEVQQQLQSRGVSLDQMAGQSSEDPSAAVVTDPDGNMIMFDQG